MPQLGHSPHMRNPVTVSECAHPRYSHRVRFPGADGKRKDRFFTNLTQAEAFAKEQRKETGETGTAFGSISEDERGALACWRAFAATADPAPPDLLSVIKEYKAAWTVSKASVKISEAIDAFIAHQAAEGSGERHLATLRSRLGRFRADLGNNLVASITAIMFSDWLNGLRATRADKEGARLTLMTRANLSRSLRTFFNFALERGWTQANPVPSVKRSKNKNQKLANKKAPEVMMPADVQRFMDAVAEVAPQLVPFWAVKFFAGIRDAEAARMNWSMVDLEGGQLHLPSSITKTGEGRAVAIRPNLAAWLLPHAVASGPLAPGDMARRYRYKQVLDHLAVKKDGKIVQSFKFPSNAARHSFGTYHLFAFRNAGETALQMGHKGNPAMLHEHYKNPAAERHALEFWEVMPPASNEEAVIATRRSA